MISDDDCKTLLEGFYPNVWEIDRVHDRIELVKLGAMMMLNYVKDKMTLDKVESTENG